jgi:hypothetical protein
MRVLDIHALEQSFTVAILGGITVETNSRAVKPRLLATQYQYSRLSSLLPFKLIVKIATSMLSFGPSAAQHLNISLFFRHRNVGSQYSCSLGRDHPTTLKLKLDSYWRGAKTSDLLRHVLENLLVTRPQSVAGVECARPSCKVIVLQYRSWKQLQHARFVRGRDNVITDICN